MDDKDRNKKGFIAFVLALVLLGLVGYLLYNIYQYVYLDAPIDLVTMTILVVSIAVLAAFIGKIAQGVNNKPSGNGQMGNASNANTHYSNGANPYHDGMDSGNQGNNSTNKPNTFSSKPSSGKGVNKNLIPLIILVIVFAVFFLYQSGFFFSSDPVGRWVFEMEEGAVVDGVTNLTDYWYMDFFEDGTLDIGWKNVGSEEDSQGDGTWYESEGVIYFTIHYNYGDSYSVAVVIKNNALVDAQTNVNTGYLRQ